MPSIPSVTIGSYRPRAARALVVSLAVLACATPPRNQTSRRAETSAPVEPPQLISAGPAEVLAAVRALGARVVVVNVWATWCVPCRQEFPDLLRLHRTYRDLGLRLVLVSTDFPSEEAQARQFLAENGVDFPSFLKAGNDMTFIDGLSADWSGALPATFLYDASGTLKDFWEGAASFEKLEAKTRPFLEGSGEEAP